MNAKYSQTFFLINDQIKLNACQAIKNASDESVVILRKKTRSIAQNARLWALLTDISRQVIWYDRQLSPEDWKHMFSSSLKKQDVVIGIDGGFVVLGSSTSQMSVKEMVDLQELIEAFGAEREVEWSA